MQHRVYHTDLCRVHPSAAGAGAEDPSVTVWPLFQVQMLEDLVPQVGTEAPEDTDITGLSEALAKQIHAINAYIASARVCAGCVGLAVPCAPSGDSGRRCVQCPAGHGSAESCGTTFGVACAFCRRRRRCLRRSEGDDRGRPDAAFLQSSAAEQARRMRIAGAP